MKRILLLIVVIAGLISVDAQIHEPVKWKFELKNTGPKTAEVVMTASIEEGLCEGEMRICIYNLRFKYLQLG